MTTQALPQPSLTPSCSLGLSPELSRQPTRQDYRQLCSPEADRLPRWLRRVWAWF